MTFDIADLISQATRREMALRGSLVTTRHPKAYVGPRDDAVSSLDRPELLWPSERRSIPDHCWNCGATRANFETKAPYGLQKTGEIVCGPCSRTIVRLKADKTRRVAP